MKVSRRRWPSGRQFVWPTAGLALAVSVVVMALPVGGAPGKEDPPPKKKAELPADLKLVPPDVVGFITLRPADLIGSPLVGKLLSEARRALPDLEGLEAALQVPVAGVQRVTVVLDS